MIFEKETSDDIVIGKINISRATYREAEEFRKFMQFDILTGQDKFIINMEPCKYIDSTFLGILINSLKQIEKRGGNLKLASVNNEARFILDVTRISEVFKIYPDTDTALKSFIEN
jgi:anti-anti-sigma factor